MINISEGRSREVVDDIASAAGRALLDVHADRWHNRAVLTLGGDDVQTAARAVAAAAVERLDLRDHVGVHPRIGTIDVVPFVPLASSTMADALAARDAFAEWIERAHRVPCLRYGPERTLPDVRRAWREGDLLGAAVPPHPTAGGCAVGAREILVAFNVWLAPGVDLDTARRAAAAVRAPSVRTLGLDVGGVAQVSCNLIDPATTGPGVVVDAVAALAPVARAEVVGLVPASVLHAEPPARWAELDLDPSRTIEARLQEAGFDLV